VYSTPCVFAQEKKIRKYTHHTVDGFRNPAAGLGKRKTKDYLKMILWEELIHSNPDSLPDYPLERVQNDGMYLQANKTDITVTWIGHSTLLLQMDGINILTDPVWSERASALSFTGPKRKIEPGLNLQDLPKIDIVVISHNHYDHLDKKTIEHLGNAPFYVVPLGLGSFFESLGITKYEELDWWDTIKINNMEIICTPAQHFSGRTLFDKNKTLWAGWLLIGKTHRIYFAGDTGYFPVFKEIGEKYGPIDIAALPIGGYKPAWYNEPYFMNPMQAIDAFDDVRAQKCIPIHWGTFPIGQEPINEPVILFEKEIENRKLNRDNFWIMKHGETRILDKNADGKIKSEIQFSNEKS
jgi:L-ascorbate metabolism protein UlaG (beta-lactamase superfamily)